MINLQNILDMPRYSDLHLLTSAKLTSTKKPIQSVEVSETPDIEFFIPEGVLLLTTAMSYGDNQIQLISLIDSLIRAKAVGLGIKTGRFLGGTIDPRVIEYAQQVNFPLFNIPDHYSLGSLLHQFLNTIWGTRYEEISFALDIQRRFSQLLIQNATNEVIINELSQMIKTPTILLDPFKELTSHSTHFNHSNNPVQHYIDQLIIQSKQDNRTDGNFMIHDTQGEKMQVSLVPIKVHRYFPHYLLILHPEQIPYPISSFAIDQATLILSFILFKNEKVYESQQIVASDYFKDLIDKQATRPSDEVVAEPSLKQNYIKSDFYQVIQIYDKHSLVTTHLSHYQEELLSLITTWFEKHHENYFKNSIVLHLPSQRDTILILQQDPEILDKILGRITEDIAFSLPINLVFSVGSAYTDWESLYQSYTQAKLVFEERRNLEKYDTIISYQNKGMLHLFNNLDKNDIHFFCTTILKDFAYPEDASYIDLRNTLVTYLDCQCEIASTAAQLYVHRNTVKYRIQKIEEILGYSVSSPDQSLNLRLALALSSRKI